MVIKFEHLVILKLENMILNAMKALSLLEDVDIKKVLVCNKISSDEKNFKYIIGYLYNVYKVKRLHIMLPKMRVMVKSHGNEVTGFYDKEILKMVSNHTCLAVTNNRNSGKIYGNRTVNLCSILNSSNQYFFGN